jgi:DNA processing protein
MTTACDACLRRTWLVARLAGRLEHARRERRTLREVLALDDESLLRGVGGKDAGQVAHEWRTVDAGALRAAAVASGLASVCRHSRAYPARLLDDRSAPAVLHVAVGRARSPATEEQALTRLADLVGTGDRPPAVAIVGARRPSTDGLEIARELGRGLAAAGVTVVSGMALGIDSAAHAGAIEGGGRSVAVLAGGADVPYPASKRSLYEQLRRSGAVVSELPPGFRAFRWSFPARNRVIAALADATVVVEAAERSGSLITGELALELGRDVGAVPGPVLAWRSAGTNALLRDGATVIRHARDALDLVLGVDRAEAAMLSAQQAVTAPPPDLPDELVSLLGAVDDGPEALAALLGGDAPVATLRAGLAELELLGLVRRTPGGHWVRTGMTRLRAPGH